jgi:hypothetical protein
MTTANRQVLDLRDQGLEAHEIAQALGYSVEAVEMVIKMYDDESVQAVKAGHGEPETPLEREFQKLELDAIRTLKEVMLNGDKDSARIAAAGYVLDQRLGLKKPKAADVTINVFDFNERIAKARARREAIDVAIVTSDKQLTAA